MVADEIETLTATVGPANATNKEVTWTSSDESVVTVDENGGVTAIAEGTAIITVETVDGGFTADTAVTVEAALPAGEIKKTAYWGTPDNVSYYFDFELGNEFKIGELTSLVDTQHINLLIVTKAT